MPYITFGDCFKNQFHEKIRCTRRALANVALGWGFVLARRLVFQIISDLRSQKLMEEPTRYREVVVTSLRRAGPKRRRAGALQIWRPAACRLPPASCLLRSNDVDCHRAMDAAGVAAFRGADGVGE